MRERLRRQYIAGRDRFGEPNTKPSQCWARDQNPTCISPASCRLAEMTLDQDFGNLHRVQRAVGGAVAKAFAREGARA